MSSNSPTHQSALSLDSSPLNAAPRTHHGKSLSPPTTPIRSLALAETLVKGRTSPGIIVLNSSLQLLYMNHQARVITSGMNEKLTGLKANGVLPPVIASFGEEIVNRLRARTGPENREQVLLRKVIGSGKHFLLLRGFAVSSTAARQPAHIIMMEEISSRRELSGKGAKERFHLSEREQTIIIYLFKGLTNKEIAGRLMVSEQTVKDHLKRIMQKTRATTRTGVLSEILVTPSGVPLSGRREAAKRDALART